MSYSRIDKLVISQRGLTSLADAQAARDRAFHLVLPARSGPAITLMAKAAVSLALRTLRGDIYVSIDPRFDHAGHKRLFEELEQEAAAYGQPERICLGKQPAAGAIGLALGVDVDGMVSADAAGWNCAVNRILPVAEETAGPAAALAVALAFAKIFNAYVLGQGGNLHEAWEFSLETHTPTLSRGPGGVVDIGEAALLGGGAIGAAAVFVMKHSSWAGSLEVIDFDRYDRPNEETTLLVGIPEVLRNRYKAIALAELGKNERLLITPTVHKIESASDPILLKPRDAFIIAVDNAAARRLVDGSNARAILNAAVGGAQAEAGHVLWTRHLKGDRPLSSFYPPSTSDAMGDGGRVPDEIKDECSRIAYENASFAAPFIALAAGSLLAASCAQRAMDRWADNSYLKLDLFGYQSKFRRGGGA